MWKSSLWEQQITANRGCTGNDRINVGHAEIDDRPVDGRHIDFAFGQRAACAFLAFLKREIGHAVTVDFGNLAKTNTKYIGIKRDSTVYICDRNFDMGDYIHARSPGCSSPFSLVV